MVQGEGFVFVGAFLWYRAWDPRLRFSTGSGYFVACGLSVQALCVYVYGLTV